MRLADPKAYPLQEFLDFIPANGIPLTYGAMNEIGAIFAKGGVICETYGELAEVLKMLAVWYDLIWLDEIDGDKLYLRKVNG